MKPVLQVTLTYLSSVPKTFRWFFLFWVMSSAGSRKMLCRADCWKSLSWAAIKSCEMKNTVDNCHSHRIMTVPYIPHTLNIQIHGKKTKIFSLKKKYAWYQKDQWSSLSCEAHVYLFMNISRIFFVKQGIIIIKFSVAHWEETLPPPDLVDIALSCFFFIIIILCTWSIQNLPPGYGM